MKINDNFLKLESSYLFSSIAKKVAAYQQAHPEADVIRLGIGDVTRPLAPAVIEAMHKAVDEMADEKTFRGYPPEYGYDFLLKAIQQNDYAARGVQIGTDEIFVSDGAKSDCGNIGDILDAGNRVAVCDPIYPVYVDTNIMAGRSGDKMPDGRFSHFIYMPCTQENESIVFSASNLYADGAMIRVFFDGNSTGTSFQDFILGPLRFTQVLRDREVSTDALYKSQMAHVGDTASGAQRLYVEGSGGSRIRFRIPDFPTELGGDKIVINQAVIVLENADMGDDSEIGIPEQLSCFRYINRGTEQELPDASNPGGYYNENNGEYRLNVTRYFQRLAYLNTVDTANRVYYENYLDVTPLSDDRYEQPVRVVLHGPGAEKDYMRMEVIYTVINDSTGRP